MINFFEMYYQVHFTLAVAMQDLYCARDWLKWPPWGKYDIFISNVLPHGKYDMEYKSCLLPRKQGSVVNIMAYPGHPYL